MILKLFLTFVITGFLTACGGGDGAEGSVNPPSPSGNEYVELLVGDNNADVSLSQGQQAQINVRFYDDLGQATNVDLNEVEYEYQGDAFTIYKGVGRLLALQETEAPIPLVVRYKGMQSVPVMVTVLPSVISQLQITPAPLNLSKGFSSEPLAVTAMYTNGLQNTLSNEDVVWYVGDEQVASFNGSEVVAHSVGETYITAEYKGFSDEINVTVNDSALKHIQLALTQDSLALPAENQIPTGLSFDVGVIGTLTNGETQFVSPVTYHINGDSIRQEGSRFKSVEGGLSTITATYVDPVTNETLTTSKVDVLVTNASLKEESLSITAPNTVVSMNRARSDATVANVIAEVPYQLSVGATWSDESAYDVTSMSDWTVIEGHDVVHIDNKNSRGLVRGIREGEAVIQASFGGQVATVVLKVSNPMLDSLSISPQNAVVALDQRETFVVTGHYVDGTSTVLSSEQLSFTVEDKSIANIFNGVLTGASDGVTKVKAVKATEPSKYVTTTVTVVDNAAKVEHIQLLPTSLELLAGQESELTVMASYSDNTTSKIANTEVTWQLLNESESDVVSLEQGTIKALKAGTATVKAEFAGHESTMNVQVTSDATLELERIIFVDKVSGTPMPSDTDMTIGQLLELEVLGIYSNNDEYTLASVSFDLQGDSVEQQGNGTFKAIKEGVTTVTGKYLDPNSSNEFETTLTISVSPAAIKSLAITTLESDLTNMVVDVPLQVTVEAVLSDETTQDVTSSVVWRVVDSVNASSVTFDHYGVRASTAGSYWIEAEFENQVAKEKIVVSDATVSHLTITPSVNTLTLGQSQKFNVKAHYIENATVTNLAQSEFSLTVDDPAVGTINGNKLVTHSAGETIVTAKLNRDPSKTATATITVVEKTMTSVRVELANDAIQVDAVTQANAHAVFTGMFGYDPEELLITDGVTWVSDNEEVAAVAPDGSIRGIKIGTANITAEYGFKASESVRLQVVEASTVDSISVLVDGQSIIGQALTLPGKGKYELETVIYFSNGTEMVDSNVKWQTTSSDVKISGNQLVVEKNNVDFTLEGYRSSAMDGNLDSAPFTVVNVEVKGVDMTISHIDMQLSKANYRVGDKLEYKVYENYASGLRSEVKDLSSITVHGEMLESNSYQSVVSKAISGPVYAKLSVGGTEYTSASINITVSEDTVKGLTIAPHNLDVSNYLITRNNGYPFQITRQISSDKSERCYTCGIKLTDDMGQEVELGLYSTESAAPSYSTRVNFFQAGTYHVYALSEDGKTTSDNSVEITVLNNDMLSFDVNVTDGATINTYNGDVITPNVTVTYEDGQTRSAGAFATYSVDNPDVLDIQGSNLYPLKTGDIELTASYAGLPDVTKNIRIQFEDAVTVQSSVIRYPRKNGGGELVVNVPHKPYIVATLSNGDTRTYAYEDVSWTVKSSELEYEQTLEGFIFFYNEKYDGEYAWTEFVGSFYFNGELYQAESRISVDSRILHQYWVSLHNWTKLDEIKVGATMSLTIRVGYEQSNGVYYDFLVGATAIPRTSDIRVASESGYKIILEGVSASGEPVGVDFYNAYGDFMTTEYYTIVE